MSIIGITMGCPAGIGPEIILRYFADTPRKDGLLPVVLGDATILRKCAAACDLPAECIDWQPGTPPPHRGIPVLQLSSLASEEHIWGAPNLSTSKAMARYITSAVDLLRSGDLDGMTTCPISKKCLQQAGYLYPGHTEMLAELSGAKHFAMMLAGSSLRVTLATIHCGLAEVASRLSSEKIFELISMTNDALRIDFGIARPRLAVAGLNPHCGEGGLFGNEEETVILPAVRRARSAGIMVEGPFPPDTVFFQASSGRFDAVVCMYHDQGLIPFKLLHFKDGVNVTLGLPIVRTSVDHGTAYDIAGKGLADATSLKAAVAMAAEIAANRKSLCAVQPNA